MTNKPTLDVLSEKEKGYIVGLFIGDGYGHYDKNSRHYRVEFFLHSIRDKDIFEYLKELILKIKLTPHKLKDKRYNSIKLFINSKIFLDFIDKEVSKFKSNKIKNKEYVVGLISGFIDAEGYVANGEILLTQKDKSVLKRFKSLCIDIGIETRKFYSQINTHGNLIWRLRVSTQFKNTNHNSLKVDRKYGGESCTSCSGMEIAS